MNALMFVCEIPPNPEIIVFLLYAPVSVSACAVLRTWTSPGLRGITGTAKGTKAINKIRKQAFASSEAL